MPQQIEVDPGEVQSIEIDPSQLDQFWGANQNVMTVNVPGKPPMQVYRPSSEPGALFPPQPATQQVPGTEQPSVFDQPKSLGETVVQEGFVNPAKQAWASFTGAGANLMHLGANLTQAINQDLTDLGLGPAEQRKVLTTVENWFRGQQAGGEQAAAQLAGGRTDFPSQFNRALAGGVANAPLYVGASNPLGAAVGMGAIGGLQNVDKGPAATLKGMGEGSLYGGVVWVTGPAGRTIRLPVNAATAYHQAGMEGASEEEKWAAAFAGGAMGEAARGGGPGVRYMARNIPRPQVRNVLTPEAQSSQRFMTRYGIRTPLSMQTGSKAAGSLEATTQNLPGGGRFHEQMLESQRKLREDVAPKVMAEISPGEKLTQEEVGTSVQTALEQNLSQRQAQLGELVHKEPVTPEEIGTTLKQTLGTGLERTRTGLAEEVLPGQPMTPGTAGEALLGRGKQEIKQFDQAANEAYEAARRAGQHPGNTEVVPKFDEQGKPVLDERGNQLSERMVLPIDLSNVQKALRPIAERYAYTLSETDARASLGLKVLRQIINRGPFVDAFTAELDRGMLLDALRSEPGMAELRGASGGMTAKAVAELTAAIDAKMAQAKYPGWDGTGESPALRHLKSGRLNTAKKYEVADLFKPYGPNIEKVEPVRLSDQLTAGRDVSVEQLRRLAEKFPEQMPHFGRAFIEGGGNWEALGPETKKILFKDPGVIKSLDEYYAKHEKFEPLLGLEPVALFNRITAKGGARINLLRDVLAEAPQHREQIGRAFIDSGGNWESLDAPTREALFKDRALIGSLDEYYANQAQFGPLLKLEPVNLFNRITAPGGTRINLTQEILAQTPQHRAQIGRAFVEGLFDTATREGDIRNVQSTMDKWLKLDDKTKNALIPDPKIRQNMNDLFLSMKRLVANPNPSGSGLIAALTKMKGNIFMGLGGLAGYGQHGLGTATGGALAGAAIEYGSNALLARWLFNQKFINILNRGIKAELQGDNASGRLAARTLKKIIEENPPEGPQGPPEGPPSGPGEPPPPPGGGGGGTPPAGGGAGLSPEARAAYDYYGIEYPPEGPGGSPPINPPGGGEGPPPPATTPGGGETPGLGQRIKEGVKKFIEEEEGTARVPTWRPGKTKLADINENYVVPVEGKQLVKEDVMRYLQGQVQKHVGPLHPDAPPKAKLARLLKLGRPEMEDQLSQPDPKLDFYLVDTPQANADMVQMFPELGSSPEKMTLMKAASAVLAQGANPEAEAMNGGRAYAYYRKHGKLPEVQPDDGIPGQNPGKQWSTTSGSDPIIKLQGFIDSFKSRQDPTGLTGLKRVLTGAYTVGELRQLNINVKGKASDIVPGAMILGPKIGSYFLDISGIPQKGSTIDMWETLANHRRMGYLFHKGKGITAPREADRPIFQELHRKLEDEFGLIRTQAQSGLWHYEKGLYRLLGAPTPVKGRSDGTKRLLEAWGHQRRNVIKPKAP